MIHDQKRFLNQNEWVRLPQSQRDALRLAFNVPKSGHAKVASLGGGQDVLISDGTEAADLLAGLNIEKILAFLQKPFEPKTQYNYDQEFQAVLGKLFPQEYNHSQTNVSPVKASTAHGLADFPKTDAVHPLHITKVVETDAQDVPKVAKAKNSRKNARTATA